MNVVQNEDNNRISSSWMWIIDKWKGKAGERLFRPFQQQMSSSSYVSSRYMMKMICVHEDKWKVICVECEIDVITMSWSD